MSAVYTNTMRRLLSNVNKKIRRRRGPRPRDDAFHQLVLGRGPERPRHAAPGEVPVERSSLAARGNQTILNIPPPMGFAPALDETPAETILLVDDEAGIRNMFAAVLRRAGYNVVAARNGADAIDAIRAQPVPVRLVISDIVMPKLGGRELFELLRRGYPGLPILLISGYPDGAVAAGDIVDVETQFLSKPFGPDVLLTRVREMLGSSR